MKLETIADVALATAIGIALAAALVYAPSAHADEWTGKDKAGHAEAGALVGTVFAAAARSPVVGCLAAAGVGLAKEAYDAQHPQSHTVSGKDFAITAVAGCLAAKFTGLFIGPRVIGISKEF